MSLRRYLSGSEFTVKERIDADSQKATSVISEDQDRTVVFKDLNGGVAVGNMFSTRAKIADAMGIQPQDIVKHMLYAIDHPVDTAVTLSSGLSPRRITAPFP